MSYVLTFVLLSNWSLIAKCFYYYEDAGEVWWLMKWWGALFFRTAAPWPRGTGDRRSSCRRARTSSTDYTWVALASQFPLLSQLVLSTSAWLVNFNCLLAYLTNLDKLTINLLYLESRRTATAPSTRSEAGASRPRPQVVLSIRIKSTTHGMNTRKWDCAGEDSQKEAQDDWMNGEKSQDRKEIRSARAVMVQQFLEN